VIKRLSFALIAAVGVSFAACASHAHRSTNKPLEHVRPSVRRDAIRRAQVWEATDVPSMDLNAGPTGHGAFAPDQTVSCKYVDRVMTGNSPKFTCMIPPDDEVKVKFGRENGEVYAEVAATRLFWALGFPADRMYPVQVRCEGCPPGKETTRENASGLILFDPASIERKFKGQVIETKPDEGWAWSELDAVEETAGGAPRAQRDALKLLAVFIQHTDNKAAQQRLVCVDDKEDTKGATSAGTREPSTCGHPIMMVQDLGQTFGRSNLFNRDQIGSVNLGTWSASKIWKDDKLCIGDLPPSQSGSLDNPTISEAGRKFLSDLLLQLSDAQLRALFEAARFSQRTEGDHRATTVDEWVDAFKKKRSEIASRTCPT
jgi:hypothetical protein